MTTDARQAHVLSGLPSAASEFVSALQANQHQIAQDAGLSGTELRALFHIARVVSITPKNLADHLELTTGAVTAIARRLVEAGLLHRVDHPDDRRSLYLELTPLGHRRITTIHEDFDAMVSSSTIGLDKDEVERFTEALHTVATEVRRRLQG